MRASLPIAIAIPTIVSMADGFEGFRWTGQTLTVAQSFAIPGAMILPFPTYHACQFKF